MGRADIGLIGREDRCELRSHSHDAGSYLVGGTTSLPHGHGMSASIRQGARAKQLDPLSCAWTIKRNKTAWASSLASPDRGLLTFCSLYIIYRSRSGSPIPPRLFVGSLAKVQRRLRVHPRADRIRSGVLFKGQKVKRWRTSSAWQIRSENMNRREHLMK